MNVPCSYCGAPTSAVSQEPGIEIFCSGCAGLGTIIEPSVLHAFAQRTEGAIIPGFDGPSVKRLLEGTTSELIGGPGWRKGVLDCIDVLYARSLNIHSTPSYDPRFGTNRGVDFSDAIELLKALYARDAK